MSTPPLNPLVEKIRGMHPGAYDDMDDATLTKAVLAKYPQYSDLAAPKLPTPAEATKGNVKEAGFGSRALTAAGAALMPTPEGIKQNAKLGASILGVTNESPGERAGTIWEATKGMAKGLVSPVGRAIEGDIPGAVGEGAAVYGPMIAGARGEMGEIPAKVRGAAIGAVKGGASHIPIIGPIGKGALTGAIEGWKSAKGIPTGAESAPAIPTSATEPPPVAQPKPAISPKVVQEQLEQSLGGKKLEPNVPLREQMGKGKAMDVPEGHTPVKSSAVSSYKYDPVTKEFHARATSGDTTYVYGDVNPEEAQAFEKAESKGKAWQDIRRNPLVAKIVNGKRVAVKPTASGDLEPILRESVKAIGAKGKAISTENR